MGAIVGHEIGGSVGNGIGGDVGSGEGDFVGNGGGVGSLSDMASVVVLDSQV